MIDEHFGSVPSPTLASFLPFERSTGLVTQLTILVSNGVEGGTLPSILLIAAKVPLTSLVVVLPVLGGAGGGCWM